MQRMLSCILILLSTMHAQAKLLEVYRNTEAIRTAREADELVLAINRSDYMLDEPSSTLLQVCNCRKTAYEISHKRCAKCQWLQ